MATLKSWRHTMTKDIKEMAQAEDDFLNMALWQMFVKKPNKEAM